MSLSKLRNRPFVKGIYHGVDGYFPALLIAVITCYKSTDKTPFTIMHKRRGGGILYTLIRFIQHVNMNISSLWFMHHKKLLIIRGSCPIR